MACLLHDGISRRPEKKRSDQSDPNLPVKCWQWNSSRALSSQHSGLSPSTGAHMGHEVAQTILGAHKESLVGDASTFGCNPGTRGMAGGTTTLAPPSALAFMISSMFGTTLDLLEPRRNSPIFPPVIVDLTTGTGRSNLLYINLKKHWLNKSKALLSEGNACMGSAPPSVGTLPSSPPGHGMEWHIYPGILARPLRNNDPLTNSSTSHGIASTSTVVLVSWWGYICLPFHYKHKSSGLQVKLCLMTAPDE